VWLAILRLCGILVTSRGSAPELLPVISTLVALGIHYLGLPACCRHRLFEAQPADDLLDLGVDAMGGGHEGAVVIFRLALHRLAGGFAVVKLREAPAAGRGVCS
jgi:hypothetical protein